MGLLFEGRPESRRTLVLSERLRRRRSSMVEHPICNRKVAGSSPIAGSRDPAETGGGVGRSVSLPCKLGQVAEWLMAADCKSAALRATEGRILPCPPSTEL